jgi:hypothetical protein
MQDLVEANADNSLLAEELAEVFHIEELACKPRQF